jgi:hypothetical protein
MQGTVIQGSAFQALGISKYRSLHTIFLRYPNPSCCRYPTNKIVATNPLVAKSTKTVPSLANQSQLTMLMAFPLRRLLCYRDNRGFRAWCAAALGASARLPGDWTYHPLACFINGRQSSIFRADFALAVGRRCRRWEKINPNFEPFGVASR